MSLLKRYKNDFLMFNDDIQGTAAIVLAGIIGALKIQNKSYKEITKMKFVIVGAGSAGLGIADQLLRFLELFGIFREEARQLFYILNSQGLITVQNNKNPNLAQFARKETEYSDLKLLEVVKKFKPDVLIGVSGQPKQFTKEVLQAMIQDKPDFMPIIFPLSNPTSKSECTAEEAQKYTNNRAIFGSGSPFSDVRLPNGRTIVSNQTNNLYIFPAMALGSYVGGFKTIPDNYFIVASEALAETIRPEDVEKRSIYPKLEDIREVSVHIAAKLIEEGIKDNLVRNSMAISTAQKGISVLKKYLENLQWNLD